VPRIRRSDSTLPGITRQRRGRGFAYVDEAGGALHDVETLERIRGLAIPPAWRQVWICTDPRGHLQAVGTDAAGRRQYLYHPTWRVRRDREKFDDMLSFAQALPALRAEVAAQIATEGLTRERVLALAVRLLDLGFFRVGSAEYAGENGSHGLATLERRHVTLERGDGVLFDYTAKGGIRRRQRVVDPDVRRAAAELKRRRGGSPAFLVYRRTGWVTLDSSEINAFIKELTGTDCSAKDFRTWHATVLAAVALAVSAEARSPSARERAIRRAVVEVARYLGNTPAVCRASYIDPRILDRYRSGETIRAAVERAACEPDTEPLPTHPAIEQAVLRLLGH
jgi:DNA topoisomerase IB